MMLVLHQTGRFLSKIPENLPKTQWEQAEAGAIYPFPAYQGAETLHIYMIWICEALQVGFEAQS
jgi:hypothetical protein